ncbi:hypothetical protein CGLO_18097 [Colletotrichum gloeosporioides Cg-14]|uniref:Uncharacterized protein n=1 Tax=Colletotrichum gloeosporioides (strain Cg-14) TaxID=1237896 RepID=T0L4U8_COLGC|nr:hypothetical protein CGLO_18097 [Colletotrichum gloeosporioides Cg-14]
MVANDMTFFCHTFDKLRLHV